MSRGHELDVKGLYELDVKGSFELAT